ncbi:hypothetical protein IFM89_016627 [Coptis chinensis]|uniref:Serine carboxypeptidase-like 18 n=1 Tax=Coptis chinensis TaxID=261450 RepID=A0A835IT40_9MAGN|nr:hypothetical protein IFM89_016627 [Coptis chinensis]
MHFILLLVLLLLDCSSFGVVALSRSKVRALPGYPGLLPFQLETGYVNVDESDGVELFYYFIESERNPKEDPLMLWLTGGPGCSAFSGLVLEIGPLNIKNDYSGRGLPTFVLNPYSWTKVCSIIFLDAPVGSGFSYSSSLLGWNSSDTKSSRQTYIFLRKWLIDHPEFNNNPLYIGGDSYCGITIPIITKDIADGIEAQHKPLINLKGYLLGNPMTDVHFDDNSKIPFAHRMALITDELYEVTKRSCKGEYVNVDPRNVECVKNLGAALEWDKRVNDGHILEPNCSLTEPNCISDPNNCTLLLPNKLNRIQGDRRSLGKKFPALLFPESECRAFTYVSLVYWANDDSVRNALHIKKGSINTWVRCKFEKLPLERDVQSSLIYHQNLSTRGYRALIYSGDHDKAKNHLGTLAWIKSLNYSIIDDWRPWFVSGQVAGYTMTYSNRMTCFATVIGMGTHGSRTEYKPEECLAMLSRWLSYNPL